MSAAESFAWNPCGRSLTFTSAHHQQGGGGSAPRAYPVRISGPPGAAAGLQAVIASVRKWNELQSPLTRGDSRESAGLSLSDGNQPRALHFITHTHTDTHRHTPTHRAHTSRSPRRFRQQDAGSRILLPKRRTEQLAASRIREISVSVVLSVGDTGQRWLTHQPLEKNTMK